MIINLLNPLIANSIGKSISDEELVKLYLETQNVNYFNVLYDRYSDKVFGKCISLLRNDVNAEDAVQEIFVKILLNLSKFTGKSKFSTWLYSITYNFCIDLIRKKKKNRSILVDDFERTYDTAEEIDDSVLMETNIVRMKNVLEKIPIGDKAILLMKYQDDLSIKEICQILDKSESAIKMKIKRSKEKFVKVYNESYSEAI